MSEAEITYPREWGYRIVGTHEKLMRQLVADILGDQAYELHPSHESETGRYVSMHLKTEVRDEAQRDTIFQALVADEAVKIVL